MGGHGGEHGRRRGRRHRGQLVGRRPGPGEVAGGPADLDGGGQQRRPIQTCAALLQGARDGGRRRAGVAPGQLEQGQAGHGVAAAAGGGPVLGLGPVEPALEAVQLAGLVVGQAEGGVGRVGQVSAGGLRGGGGVRPPAGHLGELRAVHQALAPVGDEAGLGVAPLAERGGPLRRPGQVEQPQALDDHRAVGDAGDDRPHLAGHDRYHHLVEAGDAPPGVAGGEEGLAVAEDPQGGQVGVAPPAADGDRLLSQGGGRRGVVVEGGEQAGHENVAGRRAVAGVDDQRVGPGQPTAGLRHLPAEHEAEAEQDGPAGGVAWLTPVDRGPVGRLPRPGAVVVAPGEVGGDRVALEVVAGERPARPRLGEGGAGVGPRPAGGGVERPFQRRGHGACSLSHRPADGHAAARPGEGAALLGGDGERSLVR